MPWSSLLVAGLSRAAESPAVQAGAQRLASSVFDRVKGSRQPAPVLAEATADPLADIRAMLAELPDRTSLAAAFDELQAAQDRRHRQTTLLLRVIIALQVASTALLLVL